MKVQGHAVSTHDIPAQVVTNHNSAMFRMFQGWLSLSHTAPKEGTLMVNPLLQLSTAYFLLRPFFKSITPPSGLTAGEYDGEFLAASNWKLLSEDEMTSTLQGASPGHAQELNAVLHPHLDLQNTMTHVPKINPGDFVVWHCDSKLKIIIPRVAFIDIPKPFMLWTKFMPALPIHPSCISLSVP